MDGSRLSVEGQFAVRAAQAAAFRAQAALSALAIHLDDLATAVDALPDGNALAADLIRHAEESRGAAKVAGGWREGLARDVRIPTESAG